MSVSTLQPPGQWAQHEFAFAELGDPRLTKRLVNVAGKLAANPGGTLPQALPVWAELKAAYRLFDNPADCGSAATPRATRPSGAKGAELFCRSGGANELPSDG